MKPEKFWDKYKGIGALTAGIVFGIAGIVYAAFPAISGYLWCFYVGYFMTIITGCNPKNLPKYIFSFACGYGWAWLYWTGTDIFMHLGITNYVLARGVSDCVVTILLLYVHLHLLGKTPVNTPPLIFAAVATIFGCHGFYEHVGFAAPSLFIGMGSALICGVLTTAWINARKRKD